MIRPNEMSCLRYLFKVLFYFLWVVCSAVDMTGVQLRWVVSSHKIKGQFLTRRLVFFNALVCCLLHTTGRLQCTDETGAFIAYSFFAKRQTEQLCCLFVVCRYSPSFKLLYSKFVIPSLSSLSVISNQQYLIKLKKKTL